MPAQAQILNLAIEAVPDDYTLDPGVEFELVAVTAEFADNGAGSDWLPCVELISDSGHVIARAADQGVKVTAGSDAEVSWFPWLTNQGASTPVSGTRLPWMLAEGDLPTDGTAPSYFTFDSPFPSTYALNGGSTAVLVSGVGVFAVKASASLETNGFPAATVIDLDCSFTASAGVNYLQTVGSNGWATIGYALGGTPIWNCVQEFRMANKPGNVHTFHAALNATAGPTQTADHYVTIEQIDDVYPGPL